MDDLKKQAEEAFNFSYLDEFTLCGAWRVLQRKVLPVVIPSIKNFLYDPQAFAAYSRTAVFALGTALHEGMIPGGGPYAWWAGMAFQVLSLLLAAGQTNPAPAQIKAIAQDPNIPAAPKP